MFKLESLPKDVKDKIDDIQFTPNDRIMGIVFLKEKYVFDFESGTSGFISRIDLINLIRYCVKEKEERK